MATVKIMTYIARHKNNLAYSLERQPFSVPSPIFNVRSEIRVIQSAVVLCHDDPKRPGTLGTLISLHSYCFGVRLYQRRPK